MFERFTANAIQTIILAQEEARALGHDFVGTEVIFVALIVLDKGMAATELKAAGVTVENARKEAEKIIGRGSGGTASEMPFTPAAKKALELSWHQTRRLPRPVVSYIGTGHLLLGILDLHDDPAGQLLDNLGVDVSVFRERLLTRIRDTEAASSSDPDIGQADLGK